MVALSRRCFWSSSNSNCLIFSWSFGTQPCDLYMPFSPRHSQSLQRTGKELIVRFKKVLVCMLVIG